MSRYVAMNKTVIKNRVLDATGILMMLATSLSLSGSYGAELPIRSETFEAIKAGAETNVAGVQLCWCPAGKFIMGSPRDELERRPDEDQVLVTLTKGFWTAKFETTQGLWKQVMRKLPASPTAQLPEDDQ